MREQLKNIIVLVLIGIFLVGVSKEILAGEVEFNQKLSSAFSEAFDAAVEFSNFEPTNKVPPIAIKPAGDINKMLGCETEACHLQVSGFYSWTKGVLYLDERIMYIDFDLVKALLVHEFVHYLQQLNGIQNPAGNCPQLAVLERQAWYAQIRYLHSIGRKDAMGHAPRMFCSGETLKYIM